MSHTTYVDTGVIQQWMAAKRAPKSIEEELHNKGLDNDSISSCLKEYKRLRNAKRQSTGFLCMGIGAVLGFISCVLTITNVFPGLFSAFLYGLTTIAVTIVFVGLYFIFE